MLNEKDAQWLRAMSIDPQLPEFVADYDAVENEVIAEALLNRPECAVSFEAFLEACQERSRWMHRATQAESREDWLGSANRDMADTIWSLNRDLRKAAESLETARDQRRWLFGLVVTFGCGLLIALLGR